MAITSKFKITQEDVALLKELRHKYGICFIMQAKNGELKFYDEASQIKHIITDEAAVHMVLKKCGKGINQDLYIQEAINGIYC